MQLDFIRAVNQQVYETGYKAQPDYEGDREQYSCSQQNPFLFPLLFETELLEGYIITESYGRKRNKPAVNTFQEGPAIDVCFDGCQDTNQKTHPENDNKETFHKFTFDVFPSKYLLFKRNCYRFQSYQYDFSSCFESECRYCYTDKAEWYGESLAKRCSWRNVTKAYENKSMK